MLRRVRSRGDFLGARVHWPVALSLSVNDAALRKIVRRKFDADSVPRYNADEMFSHAARNMGHDNVSAFDLHAKPRVGEGLSDRTLDFQSFFFLFRHTQ